MVDYLGVSGRQFSGRPGLRILTTKEGKSFIEYSFETRPFCCCAGRGLCPAGRLRRLCFVCILCRSVFRGSSPSASSEPTASVSAEENGASDAVASAVDALLEADPISNQFEITAMNIEYDFGLKADDVTSYKGLKSNDNGDAGLVLAIQPAAGKAQDVMDTLKTYQQDQVAFYGNYAEFAQAQSNVENAIIDGGDDLVVMVIASNDCSSDLTSAVKDVLGK